MRLKYQCYEMPAIIARNATTMCHTIIINVYASGQNIIIIFIIITITTGPIWYVTLLYIQQY